MRRLGVVVAAAIVCTPSPLRRRSRARSRCTSRPASSTTAASVRFSGTRRAAPCPARRSRSAIGSARSLTPRSLLTAASAARSRAAHAGALTAFAADGSASAPSRSACARAAHAARREDAVRAGAPRRAREAVERRQAAPRRARQPRQAARRAAQLGARRQLVIALRRQRHAAHRLRLGQHRQRPERLGQAGAPDDRHRRARPGIARLGRARAEAAPREPHLPPGRLLRDLVRRRRPTPCSPSRRPRVSPAPPLADRLTLARLATAGVPKARYGGKGLHIEVDKTPADPPARARRQGDGHAARLDRRDRQHAGRPLERPLEGAVRPTPGSAPRSSTAR